MQKHAQIACVSDPGHAAVLVKASSVPEDQKSQKNSVGASVAQLKSRL